MVTIQFQENVAYGLTLRPIPTSISQKWDLVLKRKALTPYTFEDSFLSRSTSVGY